MRKQYNKYYSIFFLVAFIIVGISCSKDDSSEFDEKWEGDIELPALHNSTADIFFISDYYIQWSTSDYL